MYQLQLFSDELPNLILYINARPNGKADDSQVENLEFLHRSVKNIKINIKSYAFDANTAYLEMHHVYFRHIFKAHPFLVFKSSARQKRRIICDPLHMIKRVRYRLLSGESSNKKMLINFNQNCLIIVDPSIMKEIMRLQ